MRDLLQRGRPARAYGRRPGATGTLVIWTDDNGVQQHRTWPRALPGHRSPCRPDAAKGLHQHRCSAHHAGIVEGFRAWAEVERLAAEAATHGYATELAEYWASHTRPTFKAYLQGMRERSEEDAA